MILESLIVGPAQANCYILGCEKTLQGVVIDPGGDGEKILQVVNRKGLDIRYVINTHGHADHTLANNLLKQKLPLELCIQEKDVPFLTDPNLNLSAMFLTPFRSVPADRELKDGEKIKVGNLNLEIIHTPGHTPGSICLLLDKKLFTGDTLFAGSVGRTDLPQGDAQLLQDSIRARILPLPDDLDIYPGHGPFSKIGIEKKENPFLML